MDSNCVSFDLKDLATLLHRQWPENRAVNIVCHGHSVPAGYSATPLVDTFSAYPHLLHRALKERYPYAVINVIVTAVGGENSETGSERFTSEVLCHQPDLITIDYALNDRGIGLAHAERAWRSMIEAASAAGVKTILLTPTFDTRAAETPQGWEELRLHAGQIRGLAREYGAGLADAFAAFERYAETAGSFSELMSWVNHPSRAGHALVARELLRLFPIVAP